MKKILRFIEKHPALIFSTIIVVGLIIHYGFFGFLFASVPTFAVWRKFLR